MITATVDQRQGATTRRVRVSASSMERVLDLAGALNPDTDVWLLDETGLLDELLIPPGDDQRINHYRTPSTAHTPSTTC